MPGTHTFFWLAVGAIVYTWIVYPLLLWLLCAVRRLLPRRPRMSPNELPFVSLVIAAYREESVIGDRIRNALELDYPADRLEILIGVDGNEDRTGDIVGEFNDDRIRLVQFPERRGKASVLNDCVPASRGEIIAFSDANTNMARNAIQVLVSHFGDSRIGCVCGQLVLTDPTTGRNVDSVYWRYENFLKNREAELNALLGVNGAIYAIRRELFRPIPANTIVDDFVIGMRVHEQGQRLVYDGTAQAFEETAPSISGEFHRRTRIGAGNFQSLVWLWKLLLPIRPVAFSFLSHKVMRWLCPYLMLIAFVTNCLLATESPYNILLAAQSIFYLLAASGFVIRKGRGWYKLLHVPAMFVAMNAALAVGLWRFLKSTQGATWKRTTRSSELSEAETASDEERDLACVGSDSEAVST